PSLCDAECKRCCRPPTQLMLGAPRISDIITRLIWLPGASAKSQFAIKAVFAEQASSRFDEVPESRRDSRSGVVDRNTGSSRVFRGLPDGARGVGDINQITHLFAIGELDQLAAYSALKNSWKQPGG